MGWFYTFPELKDPEHRKYAKPLQQVFKIQLNLQTEMNYVVIPSIMPGLE